MTKADINRLSQDERYSLFLHHLLGSKQELNQRISDQQTVGELLVLLSFLNAALVSQLSSAEVEEFARMTMRFGGIYPGILEKAGLPPTPDRVAFVVPIIEGLDYSKPPNIEDYLTDEEIRGTISSKGKSEKEANGTTKTFMSKDVSKTIQ